jgi:hypothetical protein
MRKCINTPQSKRTHKINSRNRKEEAYDRKQSKLSKLELAFLHRLAHTDLYDKSSINKLMRYIERRKMSENWIYETLQKNGTKLSHVFYSDLRVKIERTLSLIYNLGISDYNSIEWEIANNFNLPFRPRWLTFSSESDLDKRYLNDLMDELRKSKNFDRIDNISLKLGAFGENELQFIDFLVERFGKNITAFRIFSQTMDGKHRILDAYNELLGSTEKGQKAKLTHNGQKLKAILSRLPNAKTVKFTISDMFSGEHQCKKFFKF